MNYFRSERKQSIVRETLSNNPGVDFLGEDNADLAATEWVHRPAARWMLRAASMISLVSVSANTPQTFQSYQVLAYVTFVVDILIALLFTAEMCTKIKIRGLIRRKESYFRNRWCQFDAVMLFCIWASIALQCFEIHKLLVCPQASQCQSWRKLGALSVIRCPRPLILIRVFRAVLKFGLPKTRINAILSRSSQQVYNVTLFLLFFMSLYGILGVQFFGDDLNYHCVLKTADVNNITLSDLAIPDTYCNPFNDTIPTCPPNMKCTQLPADRRSTGAYIGFYSFHWSFFTVYQASSLEGWVFIMYRAMDGLASWKSVIYFISMIFFLAWLVKNVFVAVLIETFAEIRVQFQQMWASPRSAADSDSSKIFQSDGQAWRLVAVDESKPRGLAPKFCQRVVKSTCFNVIVMLLVLANAISAAGLHFNHDSGSNEEIYVPFHYTEVVFTILFDLEACFKIWCLGWRNYWERNLQKCEFILCIGTTLHVIPLLYRSQLTYFQVLRILRLIKASPMLEDFCFKIIGPGKKLGSLILFTMCFLIITSTVSLQLFCFVQEYENSFDRFSTFPSAFMSMFQILTQKGWVQVMRETMDVVPDNEFLVIGIAIYFTIYHCLVTLIVVSLFVAVILDNLELDEDIKKLKQLKMREMSAETSQKLPMRLRIFEKFPNRPQMIKLARLLSDFLLPKIRDSFMRQFATADISEEIDENCEEQALPPHMREKVRGLRGEEKKYALNYLISESNKMRVITVDQNAFSIGTRSLLSTQHQIRMDRRSMRNRSGTGGAVGGQTSVKTKLRENGDVATLSRTGGIRADDFDIKVLQQKAQQAEIKRNQQEEDLRENHPFFDKPLFAVGRESRFRDLCKVLVDARYTTGDAEPGSTTSKDDKSKFKTFQKLFGLVTYLDWIMLLVTTISCASMVCETPYKRVMNTGHLQVAEYIFFVAMTIEMSLKILANGFFFTPKAVIRDFGGVLDIFIYIISLVFVCYMIRVEKVPPGSQKQVLMILRCLRPLRIFILVPHIRRVVYELVRGFREILMVSVLLVVFMFIFAVYGVHLFGGVLAICNDRSITNKDDCKGIFQREILVTKLKLAGPRPKIYVPRVWANPRNFNFDNIGNAMLALFEILSLEGWVEIRDVIKSRVGPIHVIYIHLFVFIGCMIGLTLFVGVVIANYSESKGTALLTVDQRRWLDLKGRIKLTQPLHIPPRPNERPGRITDKIKSLMYDLTQNIYFKRASALLVLVNCALLYYPWTDDDESRQRTQVLAGLSICFTVCFLIEVILKILALTFGGYWQSRRNRYEMMVTMMGVAWIFLHFALKDNQNISNNLGWFIVILRFFTITGKHASLKMLMLTVVMSMLKSIFIIMGMILLMLVYALAGVILFGTVKYGENLGRHANFHNTFRASALLVRIVTGEDWNKIMHDCMIQPPFCEFGDTFWTTNCGNFQAALIYFCSFYIIIAYIMLNLLVAIITENFSLFYSNEEDALLSYNDIRQFQNTWNFVDINRKGVIPVRRVKILLRLLKGRLEVDMDKDKLLFKHMCYELDRIHNGNDVTFHDVLNMLSYRSVDIRKSLQLEELLAREELEYTIEEEVAKQTIRDWLDKCLKRIRAKESTNIVANLRATNEPLFTVTEASGDPTIILQTDESGAGTAATQRIRKISGTTPPGKKFLSPTLSGPDTAPRPDLKDRPMGFKRKRSLKGGSGGLPELLEDGEDVNGMNSMSYDADSTGIGTGGGFDHLGQELTNLNCTSSGCTLGGQPTKKHSVTEVVHSGCEDVRDWWRSQILNVLDDSSISCEDEEDFDSSPDYD